MGCGKIKWRVALQLSVHRFLYALRTLLYSCIAASLSPLSRVSRSGRRVTVDEWVNHQMLSDARSYRERRLAAAGDRLWRRGGSCSQLLLALCAAGSGTLAAAAGRWAGAFSLTVAPSFRAPHTARTHHLRAAAAAQLCLPQNGVGIAIAFMSVLHTLFFFLAYRAAAVPALMRYGRSSASRISSSVMSHRWYRI